jgi:SNF2 family DNA or RNA helicase
MGYLSGQWHGEDLQRILFTGEVGDIAKLENLAGVYASRTNHKVTMPPDEVLGAIARGRLSDAVIDEKLARWFINREAFNLALLQLTQLTDATVNVPWEGRMRTYQRTGAKFLTTRGDGILADDRGLGKSATALMATASARNTLVVAPAYLKSNWLEEIQKWTPNSPVTLVDGERSAREKLIKDYTRGYCLVNYEMIRAKKKKGGGIIREYPSILDRSWDAVIFDEGHRLKDPESQQTRGAFELKTSSPFFLSGSPLRGKDPAELWSMLHMIDKKRFSSYWAFVAWFCERVDGYFGKVTVGSKNDDELKQVLAPIMIRRLKAEVAPELPPKIYQTIKVKLSPEHRRLYRRAEKEAILELENGDTKNITSTAAVITRLRQIALHPAALGMEDFQPKTRVVLDLLDDILPEDRQVVIFGWHKSYLYHLQEVLSKQKISTGIITGDTPQHKKDDIRHSFVRGEFQVLLGNMAACGEGLNFDNADTAIFVERDWVPTANEQAEDRLHRLTTVKSPTIIIIACENTVDMDILSVAQDKSEFITERLALKQVVERLLSRAA